MLKRLPRMLAAGLVVPFFVVRHRGAVSMRGHIVIFSSFLVRVFHGRTSVAASTARQTGRGDTASPTREVMPRLNDTSTAAKAMSNVEQTAKNVSVKVTASRV
jgi:hypothetical protein